MKGDALDPKGLIYEAYRIDGITAAECRSIFLDWALSMPVETDTKATIAALIVQYVDSNASDHHTRWRASLGPCPRSPWRSRRAA